MSMSPSRLYETLQLSRGEIRLMEIQPAQEPSTDSELVRCNLVKHSLGEELSYQALSYFWGDPIETKTILVNNEPLEVRLNLLAALHRLRDLVPGKKIWIDAICIDQSNVDERSQQVRLMRDIFQYASEVFTWIGASEDNSDKAISLIRSWSRPGFKDQPAAYMESIHEPLDPESWEAVRLLFQRPYWFRVWVYQEVVVAKRTTLLCGSEVLSWDELSQARDNWATLSSPQGLGLITDDQWSRINNCAANGFDVALTHQEFRNKGKPLEVFDLPRLLRMTYGKECTDPRDRIYALLGVDEVGDIKVEPDYRTSIAEVYTKTTRCIINTRNRLSLLIDAGIGLQSAGESLSLPSWVPDFRSGRCESRGENQFENFDAAASTDAILLPNLEGQDNRILRPLAVVADVVSEVRFPSSMADLWSMKHENLVFPNGRLVHPTGIPMLQAYFRTLISDSSGGGFGKPGFVDKEKEADFTQFAAGYMHCLGSYSVSKLTEQPQEIQDEGFKVFDVLKPFEDYIRVFAMRTNPSISKFPTKEQILEPFLGPPGCEMQRLWQSPERSAEKCFHMFLSKVTSKCAGKSLFLTEKGYIGTGPQGIAKGDQVGILLGCERPLAIRRIEDHCLLVGACYIYGMMNGEVVQDLKDRKLSLEIITLK